MEDDEDFELRAKRKIIDAKLKARPGLSPNYLIWIQFRLYITELSDSKSWSTNNYCQTFNLSVDSFVDNVERIDVNEVRTEQFVERYEKLYRPVVITGLCDNWKASHKWTLSVCFTIET